MAEALGSVRPAEPEVRNRGGKQLCCSFCRADLGDDLPDLEISASRSSSGQRSSTSSFCSARCRDCVLALAALHPSPLASSEFISTRTLVTDRLLELWRRGAGPDPALVLEAARSASRGLATSGAV